MINLDQFTGTENYYRHLFGGVYTDGVKYLADQASAYWLIDAIFSHRRKEHFQVWALEKKSDFWLLTMREDSNAPILVKQKIEFSDFPQDKIELWLIDNTLILPSEY